MVSFQREEALFSLNQICLFFPHINFKCGLQIKFTNTHVKRSSAHQLRHKNTFFFSSKRKDIQFSFLKDAKESKQ